MSNRRDHARVRAGEMPAARIAAVRSEVERAVRRAGRDPADVRIIAVTKTFPPSVVAAVLAAGLTDIGENYVQEAAAKRRAAGAAGTWHLIGSLQRNKVRAAVTVFDWLQTVDSADLAALAAREAEREGRRLPILIQVNTAPERARHGVTPEAAAEVARAVLTFPALALEGLMTIAPPGHEPEDARAHFRLLRELRDVLRHRLGVELPHLSMGMSDDFVIAVEEGATLLRLGRALLGPRGPRTWREGA